MKTLIEFASTRSWLAIVWTIVMCVLFLMPTLPSTSAPLIPGLDKIVHIAFFAVFTFLWNFRFSRQIWGVLLIAIVFGIAVEYLQDGMGLGRSFDTYDIVADVAGALLGLVFKQVFEKFIKRRLEN